MIGQINQHMYAAAIVPWFENTEIKSGGNLEDARSIQLPTTDAQNIADSVEVMPLYWISPCPQK